MSSRLRLALSLTLAATAVPAARAQTAEPGTLRAVQKISALEGGFQGPLRVNDQLGRAIALLGDLDGDGIQDIATAGHSDDDGGTDQGAIYILFLNRDGTVKAQQKISETQGGFTGVLDPGDQFGRAIANLGDVDGDGVIDLAVGANFDDDGAENAGATWILFLHPDGTVKAHQKISALEGGFFAPLVAGDEFGRAFVSLGDFDGDGTPDFAAAAPYDDDGNFNSGAVYLIYLHPDGTVKDLGKISQGALEGVIGERDYFGWSLGADDFDQDGVLDLVVGEVLDDSGGDMNAGAIWFVFLNPDGTVKAERKINQDEGGFTGELDATDQFGVSCTVVGDLDGDGVSEVAVGAVNDDDGGFNLGAVWILFPRTDGTIKSHTKISRRTGFPWPLGNTDWLGSSLAPLGDLDLDGNPDLAIGARNDDDGTSNAGAVYVAFLEGRPAVGDVPPVAAFTLAPDAGPAPLAVTFTDASAGLVTSWSWDFGDGGSSSVSNPSHVYALPGTYTVSLSVTGPAGADAVAVTGAVQVVEDVAASVTTFGCGVNTPGSLVHQSGSPSPGGTLTVGIDNPLGTQNAGSLARLAMALFPDPAYPCGTLRPGAGMAGGGAPAELLLDTGTLLLVKNGGTWSGPGQPVPVAVVFANDLSLLGRHLYLQGLLSDPAPTGGPRVTLTEALEIVLGN